MAYLKRQQTYPGTSGSNLYQRRSSYQLPMGDDDDQTPRKHYTNQANSGSYYSNKDHPRHPDKMFSFHRVFLPLLYLYAVFSCGSSMRSKSQLSSMADALLAEVEFYTAQHSEASSLLQEVTAKEFQVREQYKSLETTNRRLNHELRMKEEMSEHVQGKNHDLLLATLSQQSKSNSLQWIQQRQETLYEKINHLQAYVQQQSRQQIIEKYGPGPHRVEFQVQVDSKKQKQRARKGKFMVKLAPIDLMPHSVLTFLEMVDNQVWDNTIFYHHAKHDHVVAAAPITFGTFKPKLDAFQSLGLDGLSFPEYSEELIHEEYTIGFSGRGPNFYINAMDNTEHHGPGGQTHHDFAHDADPCFGKIIWGKNIIQDIMTMEGSEEQSDPMSWHDFEVTHIVKVRLVGAGTAAGRSLSDEE